MNIKVISDSTCDLSPELVQANDITITPLIVMKNGEEFYDGQTIVPNDIFAHVAAGGELCTTAARSVGFYVDTFRPFAEKYDGVVHITISSDFSSSFQNATLAASEFDNVLVVDSRNLSTGQGLLVLKACALAKTVSSLDELKTALEDYSSKVEASFVVDKLDYLVKGGRCSSAAALGANLLNLKPCIEVRDGKMIVGKKYRGKFAKCLASYVTDRLEGREDIDQSVLFITYTQVSQEVLDAVREAVRTYGRFSEIYETVAGCTVSCHCGPGTLGILFARK